MIEDETERPLSDPSSLLTTPRGNIQEVTAARGAKVLTISEENAAKDTDDIVLRPYTTLTQLNIVTNTIGRLLCNPTSWTRCGQTA